MLLIDSLTVLPEHRSGSAKSHFSDLPVRRSGILSSTPIQLFARLFTFFSFTMFLKDGSSSPAKIGMQNMRTPVLISGFTAFRLRGKSEFCFHLCNVLHIANAIYFEFVIK